MTSHEEQRARPVNADDLLEVARAQGSIPMTDLSAASERHRPVVDESIEPFGDRASRDQPFCWECGSMTAWPCDAARETARADKAEAALAEAREGWPNDLTVERLENALGAAVEERDAALAREKALAEALDAYPRDFHRQNHDTRIEWQGCYQPSCAAAHAALAAHEEARP